MLENKEKQKIPDYDWKKFGHARKIPDYDWKKFGQQKKNKNKFISIIKKKSTPSVKSKSTSNLKKKFTPSIKKVSTKSIKKVSAKTIKKVSATAKTRKKVSTKPRKKLSIKSKKSVLKIKKDTLTRLKALWKRRKLSSKQRIILRKLRRNARYLRNTLWKTKKLLTRKPKIVFSFRRPRRISTPRRENLKRILAFVALDSGIIETKPTSAQSKQKKSKRRQHITLRIIKRNRRLFFQKIKPKLKTLKIKKFFFREKKILLDLILATNLFLGKRQKKKQIQSNLMKNYTLAIRNKHALYNVNMLMMQLRRILHLITNMYFYKELIMLNLINVPKSLPEHVQKHITQLSRPTFLVGQTKWVGGALTNYKDIYKRLYSNLTKKNKSNLNPSFLKNAIGMEGLKLSRPPQLPSLLFSAGECHWALNEAKKLKIKTVQCIESSHTTYFADINIAVSVSQFPLIILASLLKEASIFGNLSFKLYTKRSLGRRKYFKFARKQI